MNSHLRCSKILRQTLNAADVIGVNVLAIIGTDGREGHIVEDDLAHIAEIVQQTEPHRSLRKKRFKTLVSKRPRVEIPRLERGLSEPKSLVLPLHHTSIQLGKDRIIFLYNQTYFPPCGQNPHIFHLQSPFARP